jgi:hypothetical protein
MEKFDCGHYGMWNSCYLPVHLTGKATIMACFGLCPHAFYSGKLTHIK